MNDDKPNETRADGALNESAERAAQEAAEQAERKAQRERVQQKKEAEEKREKQRVWRSARVPLAVALVTVLVYEILENIANVSNAVGTFFPCSNRCSLASHSHLLRICPCGFWRPESSKNGRSAR